MYFIDVTLDVLCFTRKLIEDITFAAKGAIYYVAIAMVIFSHMKITLDNHYIIHHHYHYTKLLARLA